LLIFHSTGMISLANCLEKIPLLHTVDIGYSELIFARPVHYIQIVHYIELENFYANIQ